MPSFCAVGPRPDRCSTTGRPPRSRARSWCHGSAGTVIDADDRPEARSNRSRQLAAKASSPDACGRGRASVASLSPRSRIVSIIPGIETGAPDRTLTSSGSAGSPNRRPTAASTAAIALAQLVVEPVGQPSARYVAARLGRDDEPGRDRQPEVPRHHAEVGRLAADQGLRLVERSRRRRVERVDRVIAASPRPGVSQRPPDPLRRQRQVADDDAGRVADRGRDGRRDAQQRAFAHALGAVRPGPVARSRRCRSPSACGRSIDRRDPVVDRAEVPDPPLVVEDVAAPSACARAP